MTRSIQWVNEAHETFNHTVLLIEDKWGTKQAGIFIKRVKKVLEMIAVNPYMYKGSFTVDVRQAFISKQTSMYYQVEDHVIIVLYFWDNRQDPIFD